MLPAAANPAVGSLYPEGQAIFDPGSVVWGQLLLTPTWSRAYHQRDYRVTVGGGGVHYLITKDDSTYHRKGFHGNSRMTEYLASV